MNSVYDKQSLRRHLWRLLLMLRLLRLHLLLWLYLLLLLLLRYSIRRLAVQYVEQHLHAQTTVSLVGLAAQQTSICMAQSVLQQSQHLGLNAKAGFCRVRGQVYLRTFPFLNLRLRAECFLSFKGTVWRRCNMV